MEIKTFGTGVLDGKKVTLHKFNKPVEVMKDKDGYLWIMHKSGWAIRVTDRAVRYEVK
jgi:hypothetical protein